jgi:uncharacterized protein YndB with AHSA1/START domain
MPNKRVQFTIVIAAPVAHVFDATIRPDSYMQWTAPFGEGSRFEGSWQQGQRIRFVGPDGSGLLSEIAEHRRDEFISVRHLGLIAAGGVEDTTSESVRAWAPACENYTFERSGDGTKLIVDQDVAPDWADFITAAWPKALAKLKALCEDAHELLLVREIAATPEQLYRCWAEPELLMQWFCPKPWQVVKAEYDMCTGGNSLIVMRGPEGQEHPNPGVYLEVIPNRKIVFTDAYTRAWEPSAKPFFTCTVTFEDLGGGRTLYKARAVHWTAADKQAHEAMGFHEGWGKAADQLAELAASLK